MSETVKVPKWDGDSATWDTWSFRFLAFVEALGYGDTLATVGDDVPTPENRKLYGLLVTAMGCDNALNLLRTVPRNNGAAAWAALVAKQEDGSSARRVTLNKKLTTCKQLPGERALDFTARLERLRDQLGSVGDIVADGTLTSYLLNGLLKEYEPAVMALLAVTGSEPLRYDTAKQKLLINSARLEAQKEEQAEEDSAHQVL